MATEPPGDGPASSSNSRTLVELAPDDVLLAGLRGLLADVGDHGRIELVQRVPNPYASSRPSEFVVLEVAGTRRPALFCKYEIDGSPHPWNHRRGLCHEARVHHDLLAPLGSRVPRALGTWRAAHSGATCLVTEAITSASPLRALGERGLVGAAEWLGRFHRDAGRLVANNASAFAVRYDQAHFQYWLERVQQCAADNGLSLPWFPAFAEAFAHQAPRLALANPTIVHGEYYPMNILATATEILPTDWESAGVGPGEIDLASLAMGWPTAAVEECLSAYVRTRWAGSVPSDFRTNLSTAHLYLCLRMLGDNHRRPQRRQQSTPFFDYLLRQGRECGFLRAVDAEGAKDQP